MRRKELKKYELVSRVCTNLELQTRETMSGGEDEEFGEFLDALVRGNERRSQRSSVQSRQSAEAEAAEVGVRVVSPMHRSDSEMARQMAAELAQVGVEVDGDVDAAKRLQQEEEERERRAAEERRSAARDDAGYAAVVAAAEREDLDRRRSAIQQINDRIEHVAGLEHKPWFGRFIVILLSVMMIVEIGVNGWKIESLKVNPLIGPGIETLDKLGAKNTPLLLEGEAWRIFTPIILHAGILHLLFNLFALLNIGFPLEREFGSWKIALIFVASGVVGVLFSAIMVPQQLGVGASGAIFGLFGSAWADLIHNWSVYRGQNRCMLFQLIVATVVNLGLGLVPFLDNFAHFGGFVTGIILGFSLLIQNTYDIWGYRKERKMYQLLLQAGAITIIPVLFVVLILVLYLGVDVSQVCSWCDYISCVPLPPGAADEDLWWDCTPCSTSSDVNVVITDISAGDYTVTCPDLSEVEVLGSSNPTPTATEINNNNGLVLTACKNACF